MGFVEAVTRFCIGRSWPVIRHASRGQTHFHVGAVFSGVAYLQVPDGTGGLEFLPPHRRLADGLFRQSADKRSDSTACVQLHAGDLVLFHSEFMHRAAEGSPLQGGSESKDPLVAIAFDIYSTTSLKNVTGGLPHLEHLTFI